MEIPNVPEFVTRDACKTLVESLGIDEWNNLRSLEFRPEGIYAEVYARNEDNRITADPENGGIAMHKVFIPIRD